MMLLVISTKNLISPILFLLLPLRQLLTELSPPPCLPTAVLPTHVYIDMYVLCVFVHLPICVSVRGCFANNWRSEDLVKSQRLLKLNVHCYPLPNNSGQFLVFFFRMYIQCFNQK